LLNANLQGAFATSPAVSELYRSGDAIVMHTMTVVSVRAIPEATQ
jgi:hypothetical protein